MHVVAMKTCCRLQCHYAFYGFLVNPVQPGIIAVKEAG